MDKNKMNHVNKIPLFALLFFIQFCAHPKPFEGIALDSKGVDYAVEADWRKLGCERKLQILSEQHPPRPTKRRPARNLDAVSASQPIYQNK